MSTEQPTSSNQWDPWAAIPSHYNLGVALTSGQVEQGRGDKAAVLWENAFGDTASLSYQQLDQLSSQLAWSLSELGVQAGDRVFLRLPNIPEFYVSALAIAKAGAVFIPSCTQFCAAEVEYRLQDSASVAVITTSDLFDAVEQVAANCQNLRHLIVVPYPDRELDTADYINYRSLTGDRLGSAWKQWTPATTRCDDPAFIAYTSGTTGDPKGVVHYHRYPIAYESLINDWHDYRDEDIVACPAELGWLLPVASTFLYALGRGLTVVLYDAVGRRFDPIRWFNLIHKYKITNLTVTPKILRMMIAGKDEAGDFDLSSWRHAVTAGEPLPADTYHGVLRQFGVAPLDGIGMSECMVYCCNQIGMPRRPGSCGRPTAGTVIQLMDEHMQPVSSGTEGVLCVRIDSHPGMMKEYWNKPEQTAEIFRGDWYVSGDVLERDEDGYFWFKGRADDVIKASGYRISPFEVESCLCGHPAVLEAAAVAAPDPLRGTVVCVFITLRAGFQPSDQLAGEIQQYVKQQIAPYKYPRQVRFMTELPKTISGKTKRRVLRDLARGEANGQ